MESDTTVPGDKLHDPVETPAGRRESVRFSVFPLSLYNNVLTNPPLSHYAHLCVFVHSRPSDLLRYQVSGGCPGFENTRGRHVGVSERLHGQDWSSPLGDSPSKPRDRNADLCDRRCSCWTAHANPNNLGTRYGMLALLLLSTPFGSAVNFVVVAPLLSSFSLMSVSDRSWIRGEQSWRSATTFLMRNQPSVLRTSTWIACGGLGCRCQLISRGERISTPGCR